MTPVLVGFVGVAHFLAVVVALCAWERGRSPWRWFLLGLVLQLGAVILLVRALRRADEANTHPGPRLRVGSGGARANVDPRTPPRLRLVRNEA